MDTTNVALDVGERQDFHGAANSDSQLNPAPKRLLFSAHLDLMCKKLRRGFCAEEQEVLALLPFTVPNGWQPDDAARKELHDAAVIDSGDKNWARRLAAATR